MKKAYRLLYNKIANFPIGLHKIKTFIFEWVAIWQKRELYSEIEYSEKENTKIDEIWEENYGEKISKRWHKLYQSMNGIYNELYFPENLYTTKLEMKLNPLNVANFYSDKGLTELLYAGVEGVSFPKTIVLNSNGYYYDSNREVISEAEAIQRLLEITEFVIKPTIGGSSGNSVKILNFNGFSEDEQKQKTKKIILEYKENFIIQERLQQHKLFASLYPDAINTVRIITYIAEDTVYHAPLTLRMGSGKSQVDNIHAGGIATGLSDKGVLNELGYQLGYGDSKVTYTVHPDTKIKFKDTQVPFIPEMIKIAKALHSQTPQMGIISWDLMIGSNNDIVLIEGNYIGQSVWFPQIIHGKSIFGKQTEYMIKKIKK